MSRVIVVSLIFIIDYLLFSLLIIGAGHAILDLTRPGGLGAAYLFTVVVVR